MGKEVETTAPQEFPHSWEEVKEQIQRLGHGFIDEWIQKWPREWGKLVKMWREAQNYSASKAALQVGVSPATWIRWENSETQPSEDNKEELCQLLRTGDVIDGTSNATREFVRLLEAEPQVRVKEMFDTDNWIGLLGSGDSEQASALQFFRTIYEDNFRNPTSSLWSEDPMVVRISVIASCAGYSIACLKHSRDDEDAARWNKGAKYCFYDLIGLKKACKGSEWERAFAKSFLGGYALGVEDSYYRLRKELSGVFPENTQLNGGKEE